MTKIPQELWPMYRIFREQFRPIIAFSLMYELLGKFGAVINNIKPYRIYGSALRFIMWFEEADEPCEPGKAVWRVVDPEEYEFMTPGRFLIDMLRIEMDGWNYGRR